MASLSVVVFGVVQLLSAVCAVVADDAPEAVPAVTHATQGSASDGNDGDVVVDADADDDDDVKRVTFLDKARECERKCDSKRASLPECDLFCIDEPCFVRVFGSINVSAGGRWRARLRHSWRRLTDDDVTALRPVCLFVRPVALALALCCLFTS
jgi:hypothetical protein